MVQPIETTPPQPTRTRVWPAVLAVVLMIVLAGTIAFALLRSSTDDATDTAEPVANAPESKVQLEPVTYRSPAPFTESVIATDPADLERLAASSPVAPPGGTVSGDTELLYGSRPSRPVCNAARLAQLLSEDDDARASWAAAAGVTADSVQSTIMSFTPVVLTVDTAVTNHVYQGGTPQSYQAVLQRGTPVLIDQTGTPRAQCSCGNPLLAPEGERPTEFEGPQWETFEPDDVIDIEPASGDVAQITTVNIDSEEAVATSVGGSVSLDGILTTTERGVEVIADDGTSTTVIDRPVDAVFDDGSGGLVYTLARPSADPDGDGYDDRPPDDPEEAVIWHLRAGAAEATGLVGAEADDSWNDLLGVGQLGDKTLAVFAPLTIEQIYEGVSVPAGPVVAMDMASGDRTVLVQDGFGWETGVGAISFGGDRLAMEYGYSMPDWLLFDAELQQTPNACAVGEVNDEARYDFIDENCPWHGALNDDGNLVFFGSALADGPVFGDDETIQTLDLVSGSFLAPVTADFVADTQETRSAVTQARSGRIAAQFLLSSEPNEPSGRVLDSADGTFVGIPDDLLESTRAAWLLGSPVIRPLATSSPGDEPDDQAEPAERPTIDVLNMELPAGTCWDYTDNETPSVMLVDGFGATSEDYTREDYVGFSVWSEGTTWVDLDGDGTEELVVSVMCNWGGSGWANSIVALTVSPDGTTSHALAPLDDMYGRGTLSADELRSEEPGVVIVSGSVWTDSDASCCPSLTHEARWTVVDGAWRQL